MKAEDWGVGMTHGINYGYDAFKSPSLFWEHLDKVKSMEDQIWVGTFCEVASYIKEREEIQLKVSNKKNGMTITPKLKLDRKLFAEPLTRGNYEWNSGEARQERITCVYKWE